MVCLCALMPVGYPWAWFCCASGASGQCAAHCLTYCGAARSLLNLNLCHTRERANFTKAQSF
ncbi:hypothetical protein XENTR_v10021999 [Xenopus tropicalis]|nr:hypothetical protein XENTR_v10021999 [Xenopus tropicalis]